MFHHCLYRVLQLPGNGIKLRCIDVDDYEFTAGLVLSIVNINAPDVVLLQSITELVENTTIGSKARRDGITVRPEDAAI